MNMLIKFTNFVNRGNNDKYYFFDFFSKIKNHEILGKEKKIKKSNFDKFIISKIRLILGNFKE